MQTFLPYADFRASAAVLDDRRLGKQRVETYQILRALTWPRYGWKNHPAVRMWRGFTPALVAYGLAVADEWRARGRADATRDSLLAFSAGREPEWDELRDGGQLPPWLGLDALHVSHRSALLRKDPERYRPRFPEEADDLPYLWPPPVFSRYPLPWSEAGLTLADAQEVLGVAELEPHEQAALEDVRAGRDHDLPLLSTSTALLAGLCTPGRTVWVSAGAPLGPTTAPPEQRGQSGGSVSAVTARPPSPEDLEAMAAHADAESPVAFLRARAVDADTTKRLEAGLLVLDGLAPQDDAHVRAARPPGVKILSGSALR